MVIVFEVKLKYVLIHRNQITNVIVFLYSSTWSRSGCFMKGYNGSHVTCGCQHLTSFAVVMETADITVNHHMEEDEQSLYGIFIAVIISFFMITILLFLVWKIKVSSTRTFVAIKRLLVKNR